MGASSQEHPRLDEAIAGCCLTLLPPAAAEAPPCPGMSNRQPLLQVTSAPCSLGFKIAAQLGSSFFSFVNYFSLTPWRGPVFAWPARVQWPGGAPAGPPPCPAPPAATAAAATVWGSHEGPGILAGMGRQRAAGGAPEKAANVNQKARDWQ